MRGAVESVTPDVPLRGDLAVDGVGRRGGRQVVEERGVEHRDVRQVGQRVRATSIPSTAGGLCSGASGASSSSLAISASSTTRGPVQVGAAVHHPVPDRDQAESPGGARPASSSNATSQRGASWSATGPSPIRSTIPSATSSPESGSTTAYFTDDEPELRTSTVVVSGHSLRLDRGDRHGVDDVLDQRAAGQVVDRLFSPCSTGPIAMRLRFAGPPCTCCCRC